MQTTVQWKLEPTRIQQKLMKQTTRRYIALANELVQEMAGVNTLLPYTSKTVVASLPSALKNQVIQDAKSIVKKLFKNQSKHLHLLAKNPASKRRAPVIPVLRRPIAVWNNQNYKVTGQHISFPVWHNGKSTRITVKALIPERDFQRFQDAKSGTLRLTQKQGKWIAQVAIEQDVQSTNATGVIGVDLGIKVPAVAVSDNGKVQFFGNGRQNKYKKRHYKGIRRQLQQAKKPQALQRLNSKEQRYMTDQDHKISRAIVDFAQSQRAGTIQLELLANIRQATRTSRKNNRNLHTWSFYRLASFIEYKAQLAGIQVEYVNPAYTSQNCPSCKTRNKAIDRTYICGCGYQAHRDIVGATNILNSAPGTSGHSLSA